MRKIFLLLPAALVWSCGEQPTAPEADYDPQPAAMAVSAPVAATCERCGATPPATEEPAVPQTDETTSTSQDDPQEVSAVAGLDFDGRIDPETDTDWFSFTLAADEVPWNGVFETSNGGDGCNFDSRLTICDETGLAECAYGDGIVQNDDSGPGLCSRIEHTFDTAGTYYILIDSFLNNSVGDYALDITTGD